jgi:GMP synthase (glutamine-hydrolysing)
VPIVILRAGDTLPEIAARRGEFRRWIEDAVGQAWSGAWREHDVRGDARLPSLDEAEAFIITGSASSVTERAPWMLRAEEYVRSIVDARVPLLGICFGHQLMAQALGGLVAANPRGREIGTVHLEETWAGTDPLLQGLPATFDVNATHVDSAVRLPAGSRVLAATALEPHAAFGLGRFARAVQFHPEIDGDVMRGYIRARTPAMQSEGLDAGAALGRATDTPYAADLLRNFVREMVIGRRRAA